MGFEKEGFREVEAGTVVVMLIVILTNNSCPLFLPIFESTCDGALRCNDYNWKCSLRWKVAMTSRVT